MKRNGKLSAIYEVNGDFYKGEWKNDKKEGTGVFTWRKAGLVYQGDWKEDCRHGRGLLSRTDGLGRLKLIYSGCWQSDLKQGPGTYHYDNGDIYQGNWFEDMRQGWGRFISSDGSTYEGEWLQDKKHGQGCFKMANGDAYSGAWAEDRMHGDGVYLYVSRGRLYRGLWVSGESKCGTMEDLEGYNPDTPSKHPIRRCELVDAEAVIEDARQQALSYAASSTSRYST